MVKWERALLQIPVMKLIFGFLRGEAKGVKDFSQFLGCSSTLSGRELDENGKPVFRTLKRFHRSLIIGGPYVLGVLSDTSESSASPTIPGLSQDDEDSEDD